MSPTPPRLRRTRPVTLGIVGAVGLVTGRAVRPVFEWLGQVPPTVPWTAAAALLFLAGVLGALAYSTHQTLHRRKERIDPDRGMLLIVLAKSSAIVGVAIAAGYVGYGLSFAGSLDATLPRERMIWSALAALAGVAVVVAALLLERACEVPHDDDEPPPGAERV